MLQRPGVDERHNRCCAGSWRGNRESVKIRKATCLPIALALVACVSPDTNTTTVTDSAGVTIVESTVPRWDKGEGWTVDPAAILDLTTSGSGPTHEFFRVVDAVRLTDGSIAIADFGSREVRLYAVDGSFLSASGREGEGPGEFRRMRSLRRYRADSLVAYDVSLGRLTILSGEPELGRMITVGRPDARVLDAFPLADGRFVVAVAAIGYPEGTSGIHRVPYEIRLLAPSGRLLDTLTTLPGPEAFVAAQFDARPLLPKTGHIAVHENRIYLGTADRMEFEIRSSTGRLERIIRVPTYDLTLSAQEIRDEREARTPANASQRIRDIIAAMPDPESRPAYRKLLVDRSGYVWAAEDNGFAGRDDATDWEVFTPDGEWLGAVRVSPRFTAFEFGEHEVLGVWRDDLDVEHVQVLPLDRN